MRNTVEGYQREKEKIFKLGPALTEPSRDSHSTGVKM
jgi:hypothetical protein